jgi:hypothetical protein
VAGVSPSFRKSGLTPKRAEEEGIATLARFLPEDWATDIWQKKYEDTTRMNVRVEIRDFMDINMIYTSLRYFKILKSASICEIC